MELDELKLAWALFLTLPGVPFIYYGDEIGMRYFDLPTKEGGYTRTGTRTPMQWTNGKNKGFSEGPSDMLYLPVDESEDAPTVETQAQDPSSLYNTVKALTALRHTYADLQADGSFEVIYAEKEQFPFVYRRGNLLIAINPSGNKANATLSDKAFVKEKDPSGSHCALNEVYSIGGCQISGNSLTINPQSFAVFELK